MSVDKKVVLLGKNVDALGTILQKADIPNVQLPSYTAKQLATWIYGQPLPFASYTNLSKVVRSWLEQECVLGGRPPIKVQTSQDQTKKYLFPASSQAKGYIESAYIPDYSYGHSRYTLCMSTQVGCKMACTFCMTGRQGFQENLDCEGIINQLHYLPERKQINNIVFMGMGEGLDNLDAVLSSIQILTADWGYGYSPRKITLSTIGLLQPLRKFIESCECNIAISLHSPFSAERQSLMPIEASQPIARILALLKSLLLSPQRKIFFEYILFDGINDSDAHINELLRILNGIRCKINLIAFHSIPGSNLKPTPSYRMQQFAEKLTKSGIMTTIRRSRGQDIAAACGLLSTRDSQGIIL